MLAKAYPVCALIAATLLAHENDQKGENRLPEQQLFLPVNQAYAKKLADEWQQKHKASKRARPVSVNSGTLERLYSAKNATVELNLFDDVKLTAIIHSVESPSPGARAWGGEIKGRPDSMVSIIQRSNLTVANIRTVEDGIFEVRPIMDGKFHIVSQIDEEKLPPEGEEKPRSQEKKTP